MNRTTPQRARLCALRLVAAHEPIIICTLIFYGYWLGLFGQVGKALNLALVVIIYLGQLLLSAWWMRRFRFGPAEWLWRSLTYMKLQPMRLSTTPD